MGMKPRPIAPTALFAMSLFAAAIAGLPARAVAQNYPWCLISSAYDGGENCGFSTFDQCMASRLGIGGFCQINNQYRPAAAPAASPAKAAKLHRRS
jgi:Protein of unknown function (DUF3551)